MGPSKGLFSFTHKKNTFSNVNICLREQKVLLGKRKYQK